MFEISPPLTKPARLHAGVRDKCGDGRPPLCIRVRIPPPVSTSRRFLTGLCELRRCLGCPCQIPRSPLLTSRIGGLANDHPSKLQCLLQLSLLFGLVGNSMEYKQPFTLTLKPQRERERGAVTIRLLKYRGPYLMQTNKWAYMRKG